MFISSQFNYCSLLWMLHSRSTNSKINKIYYRALSIVRLLNLCSINLDLLLSIIGICSYLAVEIFKALNNLLASFISELFEIKHMKYELRNGRNLRLDLPRTSTYGIDTRPIRNKIVQII